MIITWQRKIYIVAFVIIILDKYSGNESVYKMSYLTESHNEKANSYIESTTIFESYETQQECTTPTGETSQCVPLEKCIPMINYFNTFKESIPDPIKNAIRKFVCDYAEQPEQTMICCPSTPINIEEDGTIIGPIPPPADVSNHKNLKYLPEECGLALEGNKIIGGSNSRPSEFPWMAILLWRKGDKVVEYCAGSIINERYILTAAHCLHNLQYPFAGVRVGEYSLLSEKDCAPHDPKKCLPPVQHLIFEKVIIHPDYNDAAKTNDIALIRVTKINLETENTAAICLPVQNDLTEDYSKGIVTGWGYTNSNGTKIADILQKLLLHKLDISVCADAYKGQKNLRLSRNSYKQVCLGGKKDHDTCQGDSGAPFQIVAEYNDAIRYVQRGIVSFGHIRCGTEGFPALYTNVDYYVKWILDNIEP